MKSKNQLDKGAKSKTKEPEADYFAAPRNDIEMILCHVFEEALDIEKVSVKDNFFRLGGDSIKAMRVVLKLHQCGYEVNIKDILQKAVVEDIAKSCRIVEETHYEQGEITGKVIPTPAIKDFQSKKLKYPAHYNQSCMLRIDNETSEEDLKTALTALMEHHDVLRAVYLDGTLEILSMEKSRLYDYEIIEVKPGFTEKQVEAACARIQGSIDLKNGSLMKTALIRGFGEKYLLIVLHHLVVDGVSWRILIEDFYNALFQIKKGMPISLPPKTASFIEWSEALDDYKRSAELRSERTYWDNVLKEAAQCNLKSDTDDENAEIRCIDIRFSLKETGRLVQDSHKAFTTEVNDLLLAALAMAFHQAFGQEKLAVFLEGHGREEIHKKINIFRTVGCFTCLFPFVLECTDNIEKCIVLTKEKLREIPKNGTGFGLLKDELPDVKINVLFNYLGEMDAQFKRRTIPYFENCSDDAVRDCVLFNLDETYVDVNSFPYTCGLNTSLENEMSGYIIINGSIVSNQLRFSFSYDASKVTDTTMRRLASSYKTCLNKITKYCKDQTEVRKTASDYKVANLGLYDIDSINTLISSIKTYDTNT